MSSHFFPQQKPWLKDGRTRAMQRGGRYVRSQTDYILGTYSCIFQNVAFRDARHNTNHYLVLGCLHGAVPAKHLHYLGRSTRFPISIVRPTSHLRPGVLSTPGLIRDDGRSNRVPGSSAAQSRRVSRRIGTDGRAKRGLWCSPSSNLIRLLLEKHGSGYMEGIRP